jgi:glucokinase
MQRDSHSRAGLENPGGPDPLDPAWIGLDLGGTTIQGGIVGPAGALLHREVAPTPASKGAEAVLGALSGMARGLVSTAARAGTVLRGVGVGTPGAVDGATGAILGAAPNLPRWIGVEVRGPLEVATELPVSVDNDANMAALGEGAYGAAADSRHFVCLTLGTGIGCGIVLGGELLRGSGSAAGEAGHMIVHDGGRVCECGVHGCLEAYASAGSLLRKARRELRHCAQSTLHDIDAEKRLTARDVFSAADRGDTLAQRLVDDVVAYLGAGIASIVSLLDPERIVLTGGMAEAGDAFVAAVRFAAEQRLMPVFSCRLKVVRGALGPWAGVVGAAVAAQLDTNRERP